MSGQPARRLFNVNEFYKMGDAGVFGPGDRVELIEGEVIEMTPIGSLHAACVDRLNMLFHRILPPSAVVRVQNPVRLDAHSESEPDIAVLRARDDFYAKVHPGPKDVLLVVEVADTTLEYDRDVKVPLFARAGIPEVWLVHLGGECLESYAQPDGRTYALSNVFHRSESVSSNAVPELVLSVDAILGQPAPEHA
jgi:Uma2 family endonuclease